MADLFYPPLDLATVRNLEIVKQLASEHASYFLTSPYSGEVEEVVKRLLKMKEQVQVAENHEGEEEEVTGDRWEFLYRETQSLFKDLKNAKVSSGETAEQMSYFRTATSLMEKMISLQERALGLKEISEFQKAVLDVMESVLEPSQRTEVMEKLKSSVGN